MSTTANQLTNKGVTDDFELALKVWSGEILAEYNKRTVMADLHEVKTLPPGAESIQFPTLGNASAQYHQVGDNIIEDGTYLNTLEQGERLIFADRELVAPLMLNKVEERISEPGWRSAYAVKLGRILAETEDQHVMRVLVRGAQDLGTGGHTGAPTGESIVNTLTDGAAIVQALLQAEQKLDEKSVPMENRYALMEPVTYQKLINSPEGKDYIDTDYHPMEVNGQLSRSRIQMIANFKLIKTVNMPHDNYVATDNQLEVSQGKGNSYVVNMTNTRIICFQHEAVGTAVAAGVGLEVDSKTEYRGDLVVASLASGHGILRPESVIEYKVA